MAESPTPRLGSVHLEDLASFVLISGCAGQRAEAARPLSETARARLRARLKQIGRANWPATIKDDPLLRRGYTLQQCCRLITALLLIDAHLNPSVAIPIARAGEQLFLRAMISRMAPDNGTQRDSADDLIAVILLAELVELVDPDQAVSPSSALRLLARKDLPMLWDRPHGLKRPGQRLVVDIGAAAASMWLWISERRLLPQDALWELASTAGLNDSL
jgi:hypothetical protein